jgi:hypothetical protein
MARSWSGCLDGVWRKTIDGDNVLLRRFAKSDRPEILVSDGISLDLMNDDTFRKFDKRLHPNHSKQRSSDTVRATLRGRISARFEGGNRTESSVARLMATWGAALFFVPQIVFVDPPGCEE